MVDYFVSFYNKIFTTTMEAKELFKELDSLSIDELKKLEKEINFRIKHQELIAIRTTNITNLDLSVRAFNCLKAAGIKNLNELHKMSCSEVLKLKNVGKKTVKEFDEYFERLNMDWDCDF
jgi:DNA-directed RNA polymerase subunit alpha